MPARRVILCTESLAVLSVKSSWLPSYDYNSEYSTYLPTHTSIRKWLLFHKLALLRLLKRRAQRRRLVRSEGLVPSSVDEFNVLATPS